MLRAANLNDIDGIIHIHGVTLAEGLLAKLGKTFLKKVFYPLCFHSSDVLILVYEQNNKIVSFVIYTKNSSQLTNCLLKKKISLGSAFIKNIFLKPSLLLELIVILKGFRVQLNQGCESKLEGAAELYLIGTDPEYQGRGIGAILVSEGLIIFGKELQSSACLVKTSSSKANQFYLSNKFITIGSEYRGKTRFQILYKNIPGTS